METVHEETQYTALIEEYEKPYILSVELCNLYYVLIFGSFLAISILDYIGTTQEHKIFILISCAWCVILYIFNVRMSLFCLCISIFLLVCVIFGIPLSFTSKYLFSAIHNNTEKWRKYIHFRCIWSGIRKRATGIPIPA